MSARRREGLSTGSTTGFALFPEDYGTPLQENLMNRAPRLLHLAAPLLLGTACLSGCLVDPADEPSDAGQGAEAGRGGADASRSVDAGGRPDATAATDAGLKTADASTAVDAGGRPDASAATDAGLSAADASQAADAGSAGKDAGQAGGDGGGAEGLIGPCDIYAAGNTPCVAAHSTVRALYGSYGDVLYQVRRASDKTTKDIAVLSPGGYADSAAQDSFCSGTTCTSRSSTTRARTKTISPSRRRAVGCTTGAWKRTRPLPK